jgi:hypothetical protein
MVKNIQTNTFLGSVFDEEHAGSHNFAHNFLHHRHFDVQTKCTTVVLRSTAQYVRGCVPDGFVYEVMVNGTKRYRTIHGDSVYARDAFAAPSLYRLPDMKMIARVGD